MSTLETKSHNGVVLSNSKFERVEVVTLVECSRSLTHAVRISSELVVESTELIRVSGNITLILNPASCAISLECLNVDFSDSSILEFNFLSHEFFVHQFSNIKFFCRPYTGFLIPYSIEILPGIIGGTGCSCHQVLRR